MDKACEGNETRQLVLGLGLEPVVPPPQKKRRTVSTLGTTTVNSTSDATRWSGSSAD